MKRPDIDKMHELMMSHPECYDYHFLTESDAQRPIPKHVNGKKKWKLRGKKPNRK